MDQKDIKKIIEQKKVAVIYPKEKTQEAAKEMADKLDFAICIAEFKNENGESVWGVLVNKEAINVNQKK